MAVLTELRRLEPVGSRIWFDLSREDEPIEPHLEGKIPAGATSYAVVASNHRLSMQAGGSTYRTCVQFYR